MVLVLDDFLTFPRVEREKALRAKYQNMVSQGVTYPGIAPCEEDDTSLMIRRLIPPNQDVSQEPLVFYRRFLKSDRGETFIHNDAALAKYTAIVYLNEREQCEGGTAFWRHKETGLETNPEGATEDTFRKLRIDGLKEEKWKRLNIVPMRFNRLVLFNSGIFHSRYPKENFGDKTENARLLKVYFFE